MVHVCFFWFLCISACFILKGAGEILMIEPSRLVVEYGAKASANCSTNITHRGMGWEASQGAVDLVENVQLITWNVQTLTHWDIKPMCFINYENGSQFEKELPVIIYKLPDTVSTSLQNCSGPVIEGQRCSLQCDVQNVAPLHYLKVMWYKQHSLMGNYFFKENSIMPVNRSINLEIQPSRNDDGARYWCEAKLELGPAGPQPPPTNRSSSFRITVHYKPVFSNDTETLEIDVKIMLNCTALTNPPSLVTWDAPHLTEKKTGFLLIIYQAGNYTCTASNQIGNAKKLFIVKSKYQNGRTFWIIVGLGLVLAAVLVIGYIISNRNTLFTRSGKHKKTSSPPEEGTDVFLPVK